MTYTRTTAEAFADTQPWANQPIRQHIVDWIMHAGPHANEINRCPICGLVTESFSTNVAPTQYPCDGGCLSAYRHRNRGTEARSGPFPHIGSYGDDPDPSIMDNYFHGAPR
mgnify:CR=1 FL=1